MAAIGEDSSGQEMKKKHAVGKDRRRGGHEVPRGFEPRSLDSESRVLTVTPRDQLHMTNSRDRLGPRSRKLATRSETYFDMPAGREGLCWPAMERHR